MSTQETHYASLDHEGWTLDDVEALQARDPGRYRLPAHEERTALRSGDSAQLRFLIRTADEAGALEDCAEHMWVKVLAYTDQAWLARLSDEPACTDGIQPGLRVWFQPRHVLALRIAKANR